jgi:SAM-dependent methyltransferase
MQNITSENEKTWDAVADHFTEASALPVWGPFGIGDDLNLIPEIKGKTFLEVGCGSGRSIKYLTDNGARAVYGVDISSVQLKEAERFNKKEIEEGRVHLIKGRMEDKLTIPTVDLVFSVYALGWTSDPETTLRHIASYLHKGGLFIWSWDHSLFTDVSYEEGKYVVAHAYHDETPLVRKDWKKEGTTVHITYRKTSTWFQLLRNAGFDIIAYHEPAPKNMSRGHDDPSKYYSFQKAEKVPASFIFVCRKNI